jgi:hypothetical protein
MSTPEDRRRIEVEAIAQVGAEHWRLIDDYMRALEGDRWHGGIDPELSQVEEGPEWGRLLWVVGDRQFILLADELVDEITLDADGKAIRGRRIGPGGVISERP